MLSAQDIASMTVTVAGSLDVTITIQRRTPAQDTYGHTTETWITVGTAKCNVFKPSATTLQSYADIIGSQWALMLRFLPTTDIREGDRIPYNGKNWLVQNIQNAESYTIGKEALITEVQ